MKCASIFLFASVGCTPLPALVVDACGNGVVEDGEACDLYTPKSLRDTAVRCGAPELTDGRACRFICEPGHVEECPVGWACGRDGLCRHPDWTNASLVGEVELFADPFGLGDFDGDGLLDAHGSADDTLQVAFGDGLGGFGEVTQQRTASIQGASGVTDLDGDLQDDLLVPILGGIDIVKGEVERILSPQLQTVKLPTTLPPDLRVVLPRGGPICPGAQFMSVFSYLGAGGETGLGVGILAEAENYRVFPFPVPVGAIGAIDGPIPVADLDADKIDDVLIAVEGAPVAVLARFMVSGSQGCNAPTFAMRDLLAIEIGGAMIDGRSAIADIDGDGQLDVLLDTDLGLRVALGPPPAAGPWATVPDARALRDASCVGSVLGNLEILAVGELDGLVGADLVTTDAVYYGRGTAVQGGQLVGALCRAGTIPGRISDAVVADFNADGVGDIAAIGRITGSVTIALQFAGAFSNFDFPLPLEVALLRAGDFDGDGFGDLAFTEHDLDASTLRVIYGGPALGIAEPLDMGKLPFIRSVETGYFDGGTTSLRDARTDLAISASGDRSQPGTDRVSLVGGLGSRRMFSPLLLSPDDPGSEIRPLGVFGGDFVAGPENDVVGFAVVVDAMDKTILGQNLAYLAGTGRAELDASAVQTPPSLPNCAARFSLADRNRTCVLAAAGALDAGAKASLVLIDGHARCPAPPSAQICVYTPSLGEGADICSMSSLVSLRGEEGPPRGLRSAVLGDVDLDLDLDLVVAFEGGDGQPGGVAVFLRELGPGCGFGRSIAVAIDGKPRGAVAFNADADPELEIGVLTGRGVIVVDDLASAPVVREEPIISLPSAAPTAMTAADLDGDGMSELLIGLATSLQTYKAASLSLPGGEGVPQ